MSPLDKHRWTLIRQVFDEAADLVGLQREAYLEAACSGDPALRDEVDRLLAADGTSDALLDQPAVDLAAHVGRVDQEPADLTGHRVGAWTLLEEIGRGGMGTVYLAQRADGQFEQTVAVKLLKRGMDSDEILRRFLLERQILARFEHPNIARLIDGGVADQVPYFVMEYIDGRQLTDHCQQLQLNLEQRLKLFLPVCHGVAYAHRNLVVHRDLKPSNILVTAAGEVKLLDFGVAKVLVDDDDGQLTRTGQRLLTPQYAAPEQLHGEPITTATDVYALGVLLYELLSGHHPHADRPDPGLAGHGPLELPQRPSTHKRQLRGDLDNIVLRAMALRPEARYPSADALSDDIQRYLTGQPVTARAPSVGYRLNRFIRRNRVLVTAVAATTLALLVGLLSTMHQARETAQQAAEARAVKDFLIGVLSIADPAQSRGEPITPRQMIDLGAERAARELADQPEALAEVLEVLGVTYSRQGHDEPARDLLEQAVTARRSLHGDGDRRLLGPLQVLGRVYQSQMNYAAAESVMIEVVRICRLAYGERSPQVAPALNNLAILMEKRGNLAAAASRYEEMLVLRPTSSDTVRAVTLNNLAVLRSSQGDFDQAETLYRQGLALRREIYGNQSTHVADTLNNLMILLRRRQDNAGAEPLAREAAALRRSLLGDDHPKLAISLYNLATILRDTGRLEEAESVYLESFRINRQARGEDHPEIAVMGSGLAGLRRLQGDFEDSEAMLRESLAQLTASGMADDHPYVAVVMLELGRTLLAQGRAPEAEPMLRRTVDIRLARSGDGTPQAAEVQVELGRCLAALGRADEAREQIEAALPVLRSVLGPDRPRTRDAEAVLASLDPRG